MEAAESIASSRKPEARPPPVLVLGTTGIDLRAMSSRPDGRTWLRLVEKALRKRRNELVDVACAHGPEVWAEDTVHDAWVTVQSGRIEPREPLETEDAAFLWFRRIVRNRARNRQKSESVRRHPPLDVIVLSALAPEVEQDCFRDRLINEAIRKLPSAQREVVELLHAGWSLHEIAEATDRSSSTVRQHWHRAKAALQQALCFLGARDP